MATQCIANYVSEHYYKIKVSGEDEMNKRLEHIKNRVPTLNFLCN